MGWARSALRGAPFVPELEVLFFEQPGPLERLLGRPLDAQGKVAGRVAPREMLHSLGAELGIAHRSDLLGRLIEEDLRQLRSQKTVAELRAFVSRESAISKTG